MAVAVHPARRRVMLPVVAVVAMVAVAVGLLYHDQIYRYLTHTKGSPTETVAWQPFPGDEAPELHLAVAGDVGDGGKRIDATGAAVARLDERLPLDGLVVVGDNVYPSGNPAGLSATVFEPFGPVLDHAPLYAVLGNHDVKGDNAAGQVAALGMPGRWWAEHLGDVLLVGLDSNVVDDPDQRAWLEETLASATERWRIVVVHHPPYSAGYQGSSEDVRAAFSPLFERYGVQLVLSGHDHDYQRSVPVGGVTYVVTGGASGTRRTGEDDFTAESFSWHHFTEVAVFRDRIVVRAINQDLRVADEATIQG
ncbi:MAG TPA: metallophosphoesterase [Acidimicrobiales bacterium]